MDAKDLKELADGRNNENEEALESELTQDDGRGLALLPVKRKKSPEAVREVRPCLTGAAMPFQGGSAVLSFVFWMKLLTVTEGVPHAVQPFAAAGAGMGTLGTVLTIMWYSMGGIFVQQVVQKVPEVKDIAQIAAEESIVLVADTTAMCIRAFVIGITVVALILVVTMGVRLRNFMPSCRKMRSLR